MRPDVSVVMPTKNRRPHLRRAISAALGQQGVSVEVIVIDDGSDDGTSEEVRSLSPIGVRLIRHEHSRGVSEARNAGIDAASGAWIAFLDDDDLWAPHKLVTQLRSVGGAIAPGGGGIGRHAPQWICSASVLIDEQDDIVGWATPGRSTLGAADLLAADVVPAGGSGMVVRADALRRLGGFDTSMALYEDWDLWIRLALQGDGVCVLRPLVAYRVWRSTSSKEIDLEGAWRGVCDRYAADAARLGVQPDVADLHRYRAFRALRGGRHQEAAAAYARLAEHEGGVRSKVAAAAAGRAGDVLLSAFIWRDRRRVPRQVRAEAEGWLRRGEGPWPPARSVASVACES